MLEVHNLSAAYGQSEVLHAIDLSARAGEIVALVGLNGMGKSTLMKSLIGVMPARSGQIMVDGVDVAGLPSYQRVARGLAYVPQGRQIFGTMTVKENIETGLVVTGKSKIPAEIFNCFRYWPISPVGAAAICPAVSSSNWPSRGRWPANRKCCCWTSPRKGSSRQSSRIWRAFCVRFAGSATSASWSASRCLASYSISRIAFWSWKEAGSCMPTPETRSTRRRSPASLPSEKAFSSPQVRLKSPASERSRNVQDDRED